LPRLLVLPTKRGLQSILESFYILNIQQQKAFPMRRNFSIFCAVLLSACLVEPHPQPIEAGKDSQTIGLSKESIQPEVSNIFTPKTAVYGTKDMVVTPHPLATKVAKDVLNKGGSAVDAAIAAQAMLTLVEPFASGIGGGGFMLTYNAQKNIITAYDGREKAPLHSKQRQFMKGSKPLDFYDAVVGGQSVGIPGLVKMLANAHTQEGRLKWYDIWMPTSRQAAKGFDVSMRLHTLIQHDPYLKKIPASRNYFYDQYGRPWPVGHTLKNPALSDTIAQIAIDGERAFYANFATDAMIQAVNTSPIRPGNLTIQDFVEYQAVKRKPVCAPYRGWKVCGMPAPSAGGIATLQTLMMLEKFNLNKMQPYGPEAIHLITEATRLAYADRARWVADPDFMNVPLTRLLDKKYLMERRTLIHPTRALKHVEAGNPFGKNISFGVMRQLEPPSTSHISIVDKVGNAASLTASIENSFGSRLMAGGFVLNNQLTDFSFIPQEQGHLVANRLEPSKRPRSSMSPTLLFDTTGKLRMVIGSPGGARITPFVIKTIIGVVDWGQDIQQAISAPNFLKMGDTLELEERRFDAKTVLALKKMGHSVALVNLTSGLNGISITKNKLTGGTDPRREGLALGE
jgi:gamma-glutamyltranspeptidase / glutathione hydrolase